jgi:hypothetical protein
MNDRGSSLCCIIPCSFSFCLLVCLTTLCSLQCCDAAEQAMLNTMIMASVKTLLCCCFFCCDLSCSFEFHCCDFYDLSRYVKAECFCVLLHFTDINHSASLLFPVASDRGMKIFAKLAYSLVNK